MTIKIDRTRFITALNSHREFTDHFRQALNEERLRLEADQKDKANEHAASPDARTPEDIINPEAVRQLRAAGYKIVKE
jgi:hypothetical protein